MFGQDNAAAIPKDKPASTSPPANGSANQVVAMNVPRRVVADAFYNPCGVAVQPETGHVFVSMVGRIVRVVPGNPGEVHDEVRGFPTDTYGRGPTYEFGPLGLAFAGK